MMIGRMLLALFFAFIVYFYGHGILSGGRFDKEGFWEALVYALVWGTIAFGVMESTHVEGA